MQQTTTPFAPIRDSARLLHHRFDNRFNRFFYRPDLAPETGKHLRDAHARFNPPHLADRPDRPWLFFSDRSDDRWQAGNKTHDHDSLQDTNIALSALSINSRNGYNAASFT